MPGTNTDDEEFEDENLEESEEETENGGEPANGSEESEEGTGDPKLDKRIRDLQSKLDAETARANKAEKAQKPVADKGGAPVDPVAQELRQELREASLDAIYGENPLLKQYGIDRALIEGSTRAEIRANAASMIGLIKSLSTKVRNETLAEHGLSAPATGASRKPPVNYGSMSEDEFTKLLDSI